MGLESETGFGHEMQLTFNLKSFLDSLSCGQFFDVHKRLWSSNYISNCIFTLRKIAKKLELKKRLGTTKELTVEGKQFRGCPTEMFHRGTFQQAIL